VFHVLAGMAGAAGMEGSYLIRGERGLVWFVLGEGCSVAAVECSAATKPAGPSGQVRPAQAPAWWICCPAKFI